MHSWELAEGAERKFLTQRFLPYLWATEEVRAGGDIAEAVALDGPGPLCWRLQVNSEKEWLQTLSKHPREYVEGVRGLENQYLLASGRRFFDGMTYAEIKVATVHVTAAGQEGGKYRGRVSAIVVGMAGEHEEFKAGEGSPHNMERELLSRFNQWLSRTDPDVVAGHDLFEQLTFLRARCVYHRMRVDWGRNGLSPVVRRARLRLAERWVDYPRMDLAGRSLVDTRHLVQLYDVSSRSMSGYDLEESVAHFSLASPSPQSRSIHLTEQIQQLTDFLLPTYVAQARTVPLTLQDVILRGSAAKVETLLLAKYYQANGSLPSLGKVRSYAGGYTESFASGVFKNVLHFDITSLYPSLILLINRNPSSDSLGAFLPLLRHLRAERIAYKEAQAAATDPREKAEFNARQTSFKVLINSFYGYLGFAAARFSDVDLAAEITSLGRKLLKKLIVRFTELDCHVLEVDTDGLYVTGKDLPQRADQLLKQAAQVLPEGVELELGGVYPAMFCYKAKNYALYDGEQIQLKGSALRSRGIEPFWRQLTDDLVRSLLEVEEIDWKQRIGQLRQDLHEQKIAVAELARTEYLSSSPEAYRTATKARKRPRRASFEAALQLSPLPRAGEPVSYYMTLPQHARDPDWKRAIPLDHYDAVTLPYDPLYYERRIKDWLRLFEDFIDCE